MKHLKIFEDSNNVIQPKNEKVEQILKKYSISKIDSNSIKVLNSFDDNTLNELLNFQRLGVIDKYFLKIFLELYTYNNYALDINSEKIKNNLQKHNAQKIQEILPYLITKDVDIYTQNGHKLYNTKILCSNTITNTTDIPDSSSLNNHTIYKNENGKYIFTPDNTNIGDICKDIDISTLEYIIKSNIILNDHNKSISCLQRAIVSDNAELLNIIIEHEFFNKDILKNSTQTLKYTIANSKDPNVLKSVIDLYSGYTINLVDFAVAVIKNNIMSVKLLLDSVNIDDSNKNSYGNESINPFIIALKNNNLEIFKILANSDKLNVSYNNNSIISDIFTFNTSNDEMKSQYIQIVLNSNNFKVNDDCYGLGKIFYSSYSSSIARYVKAFNTFVSDPRVASKITNEVIRKIIKNLKINGDSIITDPLYNFTKILVIKFPDLDYSGCGKNECKNQVVITAAVKSKSDESEKRIVDILLNNQYVINGFMNMNLYELEKNEQTKVILNYLYDFFDVEDKSIDSLIFVLSMLSDI